jgi:phosphonate transport system substrate-binding protein
VRVDADRHGRAGQHEHAHLRALGAATEAELRPLDAEDGPETGSAPLGQFGWNGACAGARVGEEAHGLSLAMSSSGAVAGRLPPVRIIDVAGAHTFAYDGNFRFDEHDPVWRDFFNAHAVTPVRYDDMAKLTAELRADVQTVSYLPAANYFYVRDLDAYEPFASAVYAAENSTSLTSVLVVRAASDVHSVEQLRGSRYGFVHAYCTTSYFAPALLVHKHGDTLADLFGRLVRVAAYEAQVDAVIAGDIDCTMVQEDVWRKHPEYAETTRVIAREAGLPSPVMIIARAAPEAFRRDLRDVVFGYRPERSADTLFAGFVPFEHDRVAQFLAAAERALPAASTAL